jgi:lipoate-protein ligase A
MRFLPLSFATPEENLAADEALLDLVSLSNESPILRTWKAPADFVVLGYGNVRAKEVNLAAATEAGVPIYRRCSGGGTVFQDGGVLNYSVVAKATDFSGCDTIPGTNNFVMELQARALQRLLPDRPEICGITDLVVRGKKISGNAQRRKQATFLFHGTFLLNCNLEKMAKVLAVPSRMPEYRGDKGHLEFTANLHLSADDLEKALQQEWKAERSAEFVGWRIPPEILSKYQSREWNEKF